MLHARNHLILWACTAPLRDVITLCTPRDEPLILLMYSMRDQQYGRGAGEEAVIAYARVVGQKGRHYCFSSPHTRVVYDKFKLQDLHYTRRLATTWMCVNCHATLGSSGT